MEKSTLVPVLVRLSRDPDPGIRSAAASDLIGLYPEDARAAGITTNYIFDKNLFGTNSAPPAAEPPGRHPRAGFRPPPLAPTVDPEYTREAIRRIIAEANSVAKALRLPEKLPITEGDILQSYITPPALRGRLPAIGNITTSNYTYYISVGNKFSFLERPDLGKDYDRLRKRFTWPMSRMDTNSALRLASQFLRAASMDVDRLNGECDVHVTAFTPEGLNGKHFVPLYWVYWMKRGEEEAGSVASVQVLLADNSLRQLHVERSEYILRKPLDVPMPPPKAPRAGAGW
ncbi:MAG TPA: hypothetical protein VG146_00160 [Verrucomicrobiae bacterium]|nr:hypothetical protein [Verrucomicrobiae bacterium]